MVNFIPADGFFALRLRELCGCSRRSLRSRSCLWTQDLKSRRSL